MAVDMVNASLGNIEYGRIFNAVVKSVLPYGAIVDCGCDITGLVHISELSNEGIEPSMVVSEGMNVKVMYVGNDEKGRFKFSMKSVNQETGESDVLYADENIDPEGEPIFENQDNVNFERRERNNRHFDRKERFDRNNGRDRRFDRNEKRDGGNFKGEKKKGKLIKILGLFGGRKKNKKDFNRNNNFKKGGKKRRF